jgi:MOSC domain-containing protein YiiM
MTARIIAVARDGTHRFSKQPVEDITLVEGLGVEGDAHAGVTVKHRSRVARDPTQPNLRQVHLLQAELLAELAARGFDVAPGDIGENVLTEGIDLLALPTGARLRLGRSAIVEVTGLRNPCAQLDRFRPGLMQAVLDRAADGTLIRKAGIMGVVFRGGSVRAGDAILVEPIKGEGRALQPV